MRPKLTVWYNTKCPVCDAGIRRQKRHLVEAVYSGIIEFRDINLEPEALARFGVSLEAIRRRLHAVDETGQLYVGADCAREIWLRTAGEMWIAKLTGLPLVRQLARAGYDGFANLLYCWNRWKRHW
jgi:predicted DCC family thiol-disulfide oxidoreductase YuxK